MIHERLRNETKRHHEAIEGSIRLMRPDLELNDYVDLLRHWRTVFESLESSIWDQRGWPANLDIPSRRQKLSWLNEDLRSLTGDVASSGNYEGLVPYDLSSALGAAYVIEGSTLGARFLEKHFRERFDLTPERGLRFFSGYGTETGTKWKDFLSFLQAHSEANPQHDDKIIISAQLIFSGISDCFSMIGAKKP